MKRIRKRNIGVFLLTIAVLCTGCGSKSTVQLIDKLPTVNFDVDSPVGQITKDMVVTQSFISNCDEITALKLYGATYIRENTATVLVRLLLLEKEGDPEGQEIACFTVDASLMEDNTVLTLPLTGKDAAISGDKAACIKEVSCNAKLNTKLNEKPCLIEITSPDGEPGLCPTFWMTQEDIYEEGALFVAGFEQYNDLWFQVEGFK